jgi:hypothetical protein
MANSRKPMSNGIIDPAGTYAPARTPGSLGINDQGDPQVWSWLGDTAGSLGINDYADQGLSTEADTGLESKDELPDSDKKKKIKMRRNPRRGTFDGPLEWLGLRTGRYTRNIVWPFSNKSRTPQYELVKEVIDTKIVETITFDKAQIQIDYDTNKITAHGNQPYTGDTKTKRSLPDNEAGLFTEPVRASSPKGGVFIDDKSTTTVTGSLRFSFGNKGDKQNFGGKGQIIITTVDTTGKPTVVYDSGWLTTLGKEKKVAFNSPNNLLGNAMYTVKISGETWWAGYTEFMYDLQLKQESRIVTRYKVEVTKSKWVKKK